MPTVRTPPQRPVSLPRANVLRTLLGAALLGVLFLAAVSSLRLPDQVPRMTVINPHPWNAKVDVTDTSRQGWLGIGTVERQSDQGFEQVLDQGEQWVFRFSYGGEQAEVVIDRAELERQGWRVTVPPLFAERLGAAEISESAR